MKEWSVDIEAETDGQLGEGFADEVLDALAGHAPALSLGPNRLQVRFNVRARSGHEAFEKAIARYLKAVQPLVGGRSSPVVRVEVQTVEDLDRELAASNVPDLIGVAELAALLNVSRQRASELAHSREFPKPLVVLKAGPVWRRSTVARYTSEWVRQPGRPRTETDETVSNKDMRTLQNIGKAVTVFAIAAIVATGCLAALFGRRAML